MRHHESQASHTGPPDSDGWWLVQIPTRSPFLVHILDGKPPLAELWQDAFTCWPLSSLAEFARLEEVLSGIAQRPRLLWDMAEAFQYLLVAGPWEQGEDHNGTYEGRPEPGGGYLARVLLETTDENGEHWRVGVESTSRHAPSADEAKVLADKILRSRGYFLVDA